MATRLIPEFTPPGENRILNPSLEVDAYGIQVIPNSDLSASSAGRSTAASQVGLCAYRVDVGVASTNGYVLIAWGSNSGNTAVVSEGETMALAFWFNPTHAALSCAATIDVRDSSYTTIANLSGPAVIYGSTGWRKYVIPDVVMPAGAAYARIRVLITANSTAANGASLYIDALHLAPVEQGITHYVDGSLGASYSWLGTAHQSASQRSSVPTVYATGQGGEIQYQARYYRTSLSNVLGEDISDQIVSGTIEYDAGRAIPRTIRLQALAAEAVEPWSWIAVFLEARYEDGTIDSSQRGLFRLGQPKIVGDDAGAIVEVSGDDPATLIENYRFRDSWNISTGTNVQTALLDLLGQVGVTRHSIPATSRVTGVVRSFRPGDKLADALESLTEAMGWYPVFFDASGRATTYPVRGLDTTTASRTFTIGQRSQLVGPISVQRDDRSFANVVVAIRDDPSMGVLKSVASNDDPSSPASTNYPGGPGTVARELKVNNPDVDQTSLDRIAQEALASSCILASGTLQTLPDLDIDVHDVVALEADSVLYPHLVQANGNWYVQRVTQGLSAGAATTILQIRRSEVL